MLRADQIRHYLAVMQRRGFGSEAVLAGSGLDAARLADPACLVDMKQCKAVVSNLIELTGNQGIGLEVGSEAALEDFGIIVHAMMSSRTLRQAVGYWMRYRQLAGMPIAFSSLDEDDGWTVVFSEAEPLGFVYNFCVEEILVSGIMIAGRLSGCPVEVARICLSYPAPLHVDAYRRYFACPLVFNAPRSSITVRSPRFDVPLPTRNEELNAVLVRQCSRVMRQISDGHPVSARVRTLLMGHARGMPRLDAAAVRLGMSPRSLRRHLSEEGTSYQKLVDAFRFDLAAEYLRVDDLSAKEIGYLLGFRDANAFRRAFKLWSGHTIGAYRQGARVNQG